MDTLGPISPEVAIQDSCLRAYMKLGSIRAVADSLGISVGLAHRHITEGSAHLRKAASPEHRAAVLGLVEGRVNYLWQTVDGTLKLCAASGQVEKIASLTAVGAKLCELLGRLHGLGVDVSQSEETSATRLEESARRLALIGPHSRASEMAPAVRAAMSLAGVKPAVAREVPE